MANPILAIGVGGTGIKTLVRAKERLIEAYGRVPDEVSFLGIDTQTFDMANDTFNEVGLRNSAVGIYPSEYAQIVSNTMQNVNDGFTKTRGGEKDWQWLSIQRTKNTITTPAQNNVIEGAGQIRPIGRMSIFLNYNQVINSIDTSLRYLQRFNQQKQNFRDQILASGEIAQLDGDSRARVASDLDKFLVFISGSVAGGTGSGTMLDIAFIIQSRARALNIAIQLMGLIVEADVFTDRLELDSANGVAFLRELNRLSRPLRGDLGENCPRQMYLPPDVGNEPQLKKLNEAPFDHVFLFGAKNRQNQYLVPDPKDVLESVVTPSAADFIVAHTDSVFAGKIAVPRANWPSKFYRRGGTVGSHTPFASLGTKTLIFPEQDIRKSAGLRFLSEIFRDYLIGPKESLDIPKCSKSFGLKSNAVGPDEFVQLRMKEKDIAHRGDNDHTIMNHPFIENLIKHVVSGAPNIPSSLRDAVKFAGIAGDKGDIEFDQFIGNLSRKLDDDIEIIKSKTYEDTNVVNAIYASHDSWVRLYLGEGGWGNEKGAAWDKSLDIYVNGYWSSFVELMKEITLGILNDTDDASGMLIPYRLEYTHAVFEALRNKVAEFRAKVTKGFTKAGNDKKKAITNIEKYQRELPRKRGQYVAAWVQRAKAEKELIGQRLLLRLCDEFAGDGSSSEKGDRLLSAVDYVDNIILGWQGTLEEVQTKIGKARSIHSTNRKKKRGIPVREYLTDYTLDNLEERKNKDGRDNKSGFEEDLYLKHKERALRLLLGGLDGRQFRWQDSKDNRESLFIRTAWTTKDTTGAEELARSLIEWVCSSENNHPFCVLGSKVEVHMAERMKEFAITPDNLKAELTDDVGLALQTFVRPDPATHAQRIIVFETNARAGLDPKIGAEVNAFYSDDRTGVKACILPIRATYPGLNFNMVDSAENPRAATAVEVYLGYDLEDTIGYTDSLNQYWVFGQDKALHILKSEDEALQYELRIEKELGHRIAHQHLLHPEVIDLLESPKHIDDFMFLYEFGFVCRKNRLDAQAGVDYYLEQPNAEPIMLTDTAGKTPMEIYGRNINGRNEEEVGKRLDKYKFYYALRNFVLYGHDLSQDPNHRAVVDYDICREVYQSSILESGDNLKSLTTKLEAQFKNWIADPDPLIKDLGILICLRMKTINKGLDVFDI